MPNKKEIKKKYSFSISKYGGEVAMGLITSEQYDYWNGRSDASFDEYNLNNKEAKKRKIAWIKNYLTIQEKDIKKFL